ncbi:MAG: mannose-1-phosphate guanyltransferase, partial [Armatimonadetes bacterium]|nr:mannose-1-phosphate guanyltransferase [Armatimonadota bacterium]
MKAVVMAGGEGTRLRPLTSHRPKPLVPVANKPIMEHILDLLKQHGIQDTVVTLHYLADEIVSYFGDGSDMDMRICYSIEDEPLGTAGSVKKVEDQLSETFLIISGDALTDFDLTKLIRFHQDKKSLATIALTRVENPLEYGVVIIDDESKIRRFLEKPGWGEVFSDTINTGIYVLEPEIFQYMELNRIYDFSKDLFPLLLSKDKRLFGFVSRGYWCDVGNLQQYRQANYDALQGKVKVNIPGNPIAKGIWVGEGTEIDPRSEIVGPAVIGRHCRIKEGAAIDEFSTIGDNCIIEEGATIHRSILWNNNYVGKKAKLTGCTVCRQSTLKSNAMVSEGAVLGDKCFLGQGSVIHPQVKIWPDKSVEAGATVSMSMIWGVKWPGSLFGAQGISGLANIELTPEFAMKLGAAYGAFLDRSARVITSRDTHPASRMINRSIICGLISVGVNVWDLRSMPTPVSRYAIKQSPATGGVHTRIAPTDPRSIIIEFFDSGGINIDKGMERKIENIFFREDFRRTTLDEIGTIEFPSRAIEQYHDGYFNLIDVNSVRKAGFKVVIDHGYGNSSAVMPKLLARLGCETVTLNAFVDLERGTRTPSGHIESVQQLSDIVTTLKADLGLLVDVDAEKFILVDEKGGIVSGNLLLCLLSLMVLSSVKDGVIAVPVTAPSAVEEIAHKHGGKVIRTKADPRSLMTVTALGEKRIFFAGEGDGGFIFPQFLPAFDAMFSFGKMLELMARDRAPISQLIEAIPPFFLAQDSMECTWPQKGRIMRKLFEDTKDQSVDLLEGIKVHFDGSWVLITPDPSEPLLHLYAEARDQTGAQALIRSYAEKLETFKEGTRKSREEKAVKTEKEIKRIIEVTSEKAFHFWKEHHFLGL